jgi:hypothetical protein
MSKINTIAVVGPGAKEIKGLRIPDGPLDFAAKSVYQGIKDDAPSGLKVLYAKGINYTDPQTGDPIADVLSGKCNPGAKLAISLL